jgi:hypothetical protein
MKKSEMLLWLEAVGRAWDKAEADGDMEAAIFYVFWYRDLKRALGIRMVATGSYRLA